MSFGPRERKNSVPMLMVLIERHVTLQIYDKDGDGGAVLGVPARGKGGIKGLFRPVLARPRVAS